MYIHNCRVMTALWSTLEGSRTLAPVFFDAGTVFSVSQIFNELFLREFVEIRNVLLVEQKFLMFILVLTQIVPEVSQRHRRQTASLDDQQVLSTT